MRDLNLSWANCFNERLFAFAIYALSLAIPVWAATAAYHSGAGVIGGALVVIIVVGLAWSVGQGV